MIEPPSMEYLKRLTERLNDKDESIKKELDKFKKIAEALPVAVWYTENDGYSFFVNSRWEEWTGLTWEESKGDNWALGLVVEERKKAVHLYHECVKKNVLYSTYYTTEHIVSKVRRKCFAQAIRVNGFFLGTTTCLEIISDGRQ